MIKERFAFTFKWSSSITVFLNHFWTSYFLWKTNAHCKGYYVPALYFLPFIILSIARLVVTSGPDMIFLKAFLHCYTSTGALSKLNGNKILRGQAKVKVIAWWSLKDRVPKADEYRPQKNSVSIVEPSLLGLEVKVWFQIVPKITSSPLIKLETIVILTCKVKSQI